MRGAWISSPEHAAVLGGIDMAPFHVGPNIGRRLLGLPTAWRSGKTLRPANFGQCLQIIIRGAGNRMIPTLIPALGHKNPVSTIIFELVGWSIGKRPTQVVDLNPAIIANAQDRKS